jgi:hypothetical protein
MGGLGWSLVEPFIEEIHPVPYLVPGTASSPGSVRGRGEGSSSHAADRPPSSDRRRIPAAAQAGCPHTRTSPRSWMMTSIVSLADLARDLWWIRQPGPAMAYLRSLSGQRNGRRGSRTSPVLLLQPGKVGSISIRSALLRDGCSTVLHPHHLSDDAMEWLREAADAGLPLHGFSGRGSDALGWAANRIAQIRGGRALLRPGGPRAKIILPVRDPIARSVSLCYHTHRHVGRQRGGTSLAHLLEVFDDAFGFWIDSTPWEAAVLLGRRSRIAHDRASWYQRELTPAAGVDIASERLEMSRGFAVISGPHADVLVIRTERLDEVLSRSLHVFLGLDVGGARRENPSDDPLYEEFVRRVEIPASSVDRVLGSAEATALFTDTERETIRRRWAR